MMEVMVMREASLLEVTGKTLEKIINNRLKEHPVTNNIIPDTQHGFRSNRGTDTAITTIHETVAHHTVRRDQCYIVLKDVAKAFDKVWHAGLQFKLSQINLPLTLTKLLNSFIQDRFATIHIGSFSIPPIPLLAGVPRGSSLSPTLFAIYTRDILQPVHGCLKLQYADDITQIVTYPGKSRNLMAARNISEIEKKIDEFERIWKI